MSMSRQVPKASDLIVSDIRRRILTERLPVGFRLPSETELAEEYRLGRVTVREALRLLERDGLIEIRRGPGGGVAVRHPDIRQLSEGFSLLFGMQDVPLRDYIEYRILVEPQAAAWAARRATPAQRAEISAAVAAETESHHDYELVHVLIAAASGNGVARLVMDAILEGNMVRSSREEMISREDVEGSHHAHHRLAQAIATGDGADAERVMRKHLEAYRDYLDSVGLIDEPIVPAVASRRTDRRPYASDTA